MTPNDDHECPTRLTDFDPGTDTFDADRAQQRLEQMRRTTPPEHCCGQRFGDHDCCHCGKWASDTDDKPCSGRTAPAVTDAKHTAQSVRSA